MNATVIVITVLILTVFIAIGRSLRNNGNSTDKLRDNNRESESINRETSDIINKLGSENREAGNLNESIREDNKTAGDIIKQVRKQKLDR